MESSDIVWEAPEFEIRPKEASWYWGSIVVAVFLIAIAAWQQNILFILFLLVAELLILVWAMREPRMYTFRMDEKGLAVGERLFYPYTEIEHFSIYDADTDEWLTVTFKLVSRTRPTLRVRLPREKHSDVRQKLQSVTKEIEGEEHIFDTIEKLLGF